MSEETKIMIGLEIHAYLGTQSKLFCSCSASESAEPNVNVCPICLGHPGSKPVLNEKAVEFGTKIGLALNCTINRNFFFSRKTYFYPDMSMNYQITQYEVPVAQKGFLVLPSGKKVSIRRAHLEWDPAALVHPNGMGSSDSVLIDYNRSGLALVEIVTEPEISSPAEAREFMNTLENILQYLNVLRPETTLKVDCNISINGGNRVEIKNVSGYAAVEKALNYELARQKQEEKMGRNILQHTRAFNAQSGVTLMLRTKETEEDYGYIFDPDLVAVELSEEYLKEVRTLMPELPQQKAKRLQEKFNLTEYDARVICSDFDLGKLFDEMVAKGSNAVLSAKILTRELLSVLNHDSLSFKQVDIEADDLGELVSMIEEGIVSDKNVKESVINYISGDKTKPKDFLEKNNLLISESVDIDLIVGKIISENKKAVDDYHDGNEKSLNFLAGLVMRQTKGTAKIQQVIEKIKKRLS